MGSLAVLFFRRSYAAGLKMVKKSPVFVIMTIDAQVLPVAPVAGIIIMVVVLVMDRQHVNIFIGELSSASRAYPWMYP